MKWLGPGFYVATLSLCFYYRRVTATRFPDGRGGGGRGGGRKKMSFLVCFAFKAVVFNVVCYHERTEVIASAISCFLLHGSANNACDSYELLKEGVEKWGISTVPVNA